PTKWKQVVCRNLTGGKSHDGEILVRVEQRAAEPGEMLEAADDASVLQRPEVSRRVFRNLRRRRAESPRLKPVSDPATVRREVIEYGREVEIDAEQSQRSGGQ